METKISRAKKELIISDSGPTIMIGERINPTGKKKLAESLKAGEFDVLRQEAIAQVEAGADILDVNVAAPDLDEIYVLPKAMEAIMAVVDVPLCIDISNPAALAEALKVYEGKPIVNSVSGEEKSLNEVLPLVKEYGTAVIGLTLDDDGIPHEPGKRLEIAYKIIERAGSLGIPVEDIVIDCLTLSIGPDDQAGFITLQAIQKVRAELRVNQTLGASNISFGLPDRPLVNKIFLSLAIQAGVTCPTVDAEKVRPAILATDLILGRDRFSQRFIKDYRQRQMK
ncbi:MAG: pterin-binding protein [Spirochaetes bacterium RBG_13_51_14]|nr:MAG: pterin-binding protein [Spirochaetes bacterium RBG_13_51_14]